MIPVTQDSLRELHQALSTIVFARGVVGVVPRPPRQRGPRHLPLFGLGAFTEIPNPDGVVGYECVLRGVDVVEARVILYAHRPLDATDLAERIRVKTNAPVTIVALRAGCVLPPFAGPGSRVCRVAFGTAGTVTTVLKSSAGGRAISAAHVIAGGAFPYAGECLAIDGVRGAPLEKWSLPTTAAGASAARPDVGTTGPRTTLGSPSAWPDGHPYAGERSFSLATAPFTVFPYRAPAGIDVKASPIGTPVTLSGVAYADVFGMKTSSTTAFWSGDSGAPLRDAKGYLVAMLVGRLDATPSVGVFAPWEHIRARLSAWGIS